MSSKNSSTYKTKRTQDFQKNVDLEVMLEDVNGLLGEIDTDSIRSSIYSNKEHPIIFVMGPHRSGSTLFMQWIANAGNFAYPTNLLSRFYAAPIIGAKIQLLLTDPRYNFRDEILDFNSSISFESENGKTKGATSPNEFWYFWRRFLPFGEIDWLPNDELMKVVDTGTLVGELTGLTRVYKKPLALKAMILNYNIEFLNKIFKKAIFIYTKRNPISNIESALDARIKQTGSIDNWYSFKIPEYSELKKLKPEEQVAGQIYYINKAVSEGLKPVPEEKKLVVPYEDFCSDPGSVYLELKNLLSKQGSVIGEYKGEKSFKISRTQNENSSVNKLYEKFLAGK